MRKTKNMHIKTRKHAKSKNKGSSKIKLHRRTLRRKLKRQNQIVHQGGSNKPQQNKQLSTPSNSNTTSKQILETNQDQHPTSNSSTLLTKEAIASERAKTVYNNANIKPLKDGIDAVYNTTTQVATDIRNKGISTISDKITTGIGAGLGAAGIDISDPVKTQGQIDGVYDLITSDENKEKFVEIGKDIGKIGIAVGSELIPLVTPLIDETILIAEKGAEKAIDSALNTGKFGVTSALGPLAGVPLAVMSAVDAGVSIADTGSKLATTISDTTSAAINVSNKILNEQEKTINRISKTADTFFEPPKINVNIDSPKTSQIIPEVKQIKNQKSHIQSQGGRKTRSCLKSYGKNKTLKRVKFNRILEFEGGFKDEYE
jgi:hypothetical protein